jgi:phage baseplate assembly protein W
MPSNPTYGISFPFLQSQYGDYLNLTLTNTEEIRTNLIHLLLTRKGTRYYMPEFGTRLYEYIFEPLDGPTFSQIESEIRDAVSTYLPQLTLTNVQITDASQEEENKGTYIDPNGVRTFVVPGIAEKEHTAKIRIDYQVTSDTFASSDFVIINI